MRCGEGGCDVWRRECCVVVLCDELEVRLGRNKFTFEKKK